MGREVDKEYDRNSFANSKATSYEKTFTLTILCSKVIHEMVKHRRCHSAVWKEYELLGNVFLDF
jgi:hypothetical protein